MKEKAVSQADKEALAKAFVENEARRKTPNTRVSEESFFAISNRGAERIRNLLGKLAEN